MRPDEIEARMRALECYHSLAFPAGAWVILRLDGRRFSRFTEGRFDKPFDERFHGFMLQATQMVFEEFGALYACTHSDEASLLLPRGFDRWSREVEKCVSLSASLAAGVFSVACGVPVSFDARACLAPLDEQVVDYFRWRQADAARCALNGWCYWTLRKQGQGVAEATDALRGKSNGWKNQTLFESGVNFNDVPLWQKRGSGLRREETARTGHDPMRGEDVETTRRSVVIDRELPMGDEYGRYMAALLG